MSLVSMQITTTCTVHAGRGSITLTELITRVTARPASPLAVVFKLRSSCHPYGRLECFLRFLATARPRSGRTSFTTPNPMLLAMVMPKLTAPSPAECWLGGCQNLDKKAPAATPLVGKQTDVGFRHRAERGCRSPEHTRLVAKDPSYRS